MKKIFYIPQFSMNDGKQAFICNDGNFIVLKTMVKHFIEYSKRNNEQIHIICCLPPTQKQTQNNYGYVSDKDLESFVNQIQKMRENTGVFVQFLISGVFQISPICARFSLPIPPNDLVNFFQRENFDLIINNIPEITKNLYAFLPIDSKCKIISMFHFNEHLFSGNHLTKSWSNGSKIGYDLRQFDALLCSDYNFMNCFSEIVESFIYIKNAFAPQLYSYIIDKVKSITSYLSYVDFDEYEKLSGKNIEIQDQFENEFSGGYSLFPARITESGYTNWQYVFEIYKDSDFPIVFCNPSGKKGIDCIKKLYPSLDLSNEIDVQFQVQNKKVTDVEYIKFIKVGKNIFISENSLPKHVYYLLGEYASFIVNMYVNEKYGGISIRELYAINHNSNGKAIPIVPNIGEFIAWNKYLMETINDPFFLSETASFAPNKISLEKDNISNGKDMLYQWMSVKKRISDGSILNDVYEKIKNKENWNTRCNEFGNIVNMLLTNKKGE